MKLYTAITSTAILLAFIAIAWLGGSPRWVFVFYPMLIVVIKNWSDYNYDRIRKELTADRCSQCVTDKSWCLYCRDYYYYVGTPAETRFERKQREDA